MTSRSYQRPLRLRGSENNMGNKDIKTNLEEVNDQIRRSARKAGRKPEEITLVAVTKFVPVERIAEAIRAGVTDIGENRVQEGVQKFPALAEFHLTRHLIGHLQKNKVRQALQLFDIIHSIDSLELAERVDRIAGEMGVRPKVFFQLNVSGEESKHGFGPGEFFQAAPQLAKLEQIDPIGLMTMAPLEEEPEAARPVFRKLREVRDKLNEQGILKRPLKGLSMGMSNDFTIAIEEGATHIRVGSRIFKS